MSRCKHWMNRGWWIAETHKGRTRMMCRECGGFVGYVVAVSKAESEKDTADGAVDGDGK